MFTFKKSTLLVASLLALSTALAGCGGANEGTSNNGDKKAESTEVSTERTLIDALGHEVTIPANPKRVIASYLEDNLVALGITPAAQWTVANGVQDYLQDSLKDIPTISYDLPLEAVMDVNPDLIIVEAASAVEGGKYEQYSKIAPTYVVAKESNDDWREELQTVGEVFGKSDKAKQVLEEYDKKAAEAREKLQKANKNESAAAVWLVGNKFFIVGEKVSSGAVLYGDLGLATPNVVKEISDTATANWSEISLEKLAELNADHIFLINSDKGNGSEMLKESTWKNIPAVKNGHIYEYGAETSWLYSGAIANSQIIDDVLESMIQ